MLDDWGDMLGLKGSGSHSIRFDRHPHPAGTGAFEGNHVDSTSPAARGARACTATRCTRGRAMSVFTISLAAVTVGAVQRARRVRAADAHKTTASAVRPRIQDREYQRWYGRAPTHIATAEAVLHRAAERAHGALPGNVEDGVGYSYGDDMLLAGIAREVMLMCWDVIDDDLWQTVGASVARDGERIARSSATWRSRRRTATCSCATFLRRDRPRRAGEPRIPFGR